MVECEVKTKKVGNSIGFVVPKEVVKELRIRPNEVVLIKLKDRTLYAKFYQQNL